MRTKEDIKIEIESCNEWISQYKRGIAEYKSDLAEIVTFIRDDESEIEVQEECLEGLRGELKVINAILAQPSSK